MQHVLSHPTMSSLSHVSGLGSAIWEDSPVFGSPFAAAAAAGHSTLVDRFIADYDTYFADNPTDAHLKSFSEAIYASIKKRHAKIVESTVTAYEKHFSKVPGKEFQRWLFEAVAVGKEDILRTLFRVSHVGGPSRLVKGFTEACRIGKVASMRVFFDEGILDINQELPNSGKQSAGITCADVALFGVVTD